MATMNVKKSKFQKDTSVTVNHEGSVVHSFNALDDLFSKVLSSFFGESTHYENRNVFSDYSRVQKLVSEVSDEDKEYVLKIAKLGRKLNMISYPLALLSVCFNDRRFCGEDFVGRNRNKLQDYSYHITKRGKDIIELMSMQLNMYQGLPLPSQFRKSIKNSLESFNEFQLAKALGKNKTVSLADVIKLIHPNPRNSKVRKEFFREVIEDRVKYADGVAQLHTEVGRKGNEEKVKESIKTSSLLSVLKNLVSMYRSGVLKDEYLGICSRFEDLSEVQRSKILPFRFYIAYREVEREFSSSKMKNAVLTSLSIALDNSVNNMEDINGFNCIVVDVSGSMHRSVSSMSNTNADDIAMVLGAMCAKKSNADVILFASRAKLINVAKNSSVIDLVEKFNRERKDVGGSTNLLGVLDLIRKNGVKYNNFIIMTDSDCYGRFTGGKFIINCDEEITKLMKDGYFNKVYLNDMLGNSFGIVNTNDYRKNLIGGFSERIIEMINVYENMGTGDIRKVIDKLLSNG